MSETLKNSIPLTEVVSPLLNDVEYASKLEGVFQNINDNFTQLANRDFVKGESGASIEIKAVDLYKDGQLTVYGERLKASIESLSVNKDDYADVIWTDEDGGKHTLNIFDNLCGPDANPGKVYMIYNKANDNTTPIALSSLYYVFLDGRYANKVIGKIDDGQYTKIKDMSCILVYDNSISGFKALENAFPTIYYEKGIGLCWEINGNGTGIPVRGIPGKDGANATLHIVKCDSIEDTGDMIIRAEVDGIYGMYDGYSEIDGDISQYDGQAALILITNVDKGFYFGYLHVENDKLYAYCDQETAINYGIETEAVINAMKKINLLNKGEDASSGAKGLFIPMQAEKDGVQPVHLLSSTSITNTEGQTSDLKADFIFTPIDDINKLNVNDTDALQVDKYLYLRISKNARDTINIDTKLCEPYNYTLKYKLTNIAKDVNDTWFSVLSSNGDDIIGSRAFGEVKRNGGSVTLSDNNVVYYGLDNKLTTDHIKTMPAAFAERLANSGVTKNNIGIYRWELCTIVNDFDIDELKQLNAAKYTFPAEFSVVYTTTINPSNTSDFMWFNAQHLAGEADLGIDDSNNNNGQIISGSYSERYVVLGWNTGNNDSVLEFVKFVPIYDNDFNVGEDTALNINYNVNITGDEDNPKRSITIHGSINSDDLSVYHLTATGEIANIFTRDDIVGEKGIKLGKKLDSDDYNFVVNSNGQIDTSADINTSANMSSKSLNVDSLAHTGRLETNDLRLMATNGTRYIYAGFGDPDALTSDNHFNVELNGVDTFNVIRKTVKGELFAGTPEQRNLAQPIISSDAPIRQHNKSNIIISNEPQDGSNLCYYGVSSMVSNPNTPSSPYDGGAGVSGNATGKHFVINPDFDHVKNFNIHRMSIDSKAGTQVKASNASISRNREFNTATRILYTETSYVREMDCKSEATINTDRCIETFNIQRDIANEDKKSIVTQFDRSQPIYISFNSSYTYLTHIGVKGENSNGRWPVMMNNSYVRLGLYYKVGGTTTYTKVAEHKYTLDFTTSNNNDDNGYEWKGYNRGTNTSPNGDTAWRFYPYALKIKQFVINTNGTFTDANGKTTNLAEVYNDIADAYDAGKSIEFFVFPEVYLHAMGQKESWIKGRDPKKVVCGLEAYTFIPIENISSISSSSTSIKNLKNVSESTAKKYATMWKASGALTVKNEVGTISFTTREIPKNNSTTKITTICEDGIVIRSGEHVFGIGAGAQVYDHLKNGYNVQSSSNPTWNPKTGMTASYLENEPILFYHTSLGDYYDSKKEPKTGGKDLKGYALRTHAIPLKDIFNVVRMMNESSTAKYGV